MRRHNFDDRLRERVQFATQDCIDDYCTINPGVPPAAAFVFLMFDISISFLDGEFREAVVNKDKPSEDE